MAVSLKYDILGEIFSYLDVKDLVRCSAVCKDWNTVSKAAYLWVVFAREIQSRWPGGEIAPDPRAQVVMYYAVIGERISVRGNFATVCRMNGLQTVVFVHGRPCEEESEKPWQMVHRRKLIRLPS